MLKSIFVESIYVEKGPSERTTNLDGHELAAGESWWGGHSWTRAFAVLRCHSRALRPSEVAVGSEAPQRGSCVAAAVFLRGRDAWPRRFFSFEAFLLSCSLKAYIPRSSIYAAASIGCEMFITDALRTGVGGWTRLDKETRAIRYQSFS